MITAGSQRSSGSQSHSTSDARVSQLAAGGDLTLIANGGSITSQGAQMSAEGNAVLLATKNINFEVAHNTETSTSESSGKGWGFANNTSGLPFGTNNSRSEGSGSSDTITGTQLSVGGGVRMATTEGDISLTAANIAAEKDVNIRAAGNLLVQSGQDTVANANTADSKAIGTVQISDTEKFSGWHRQQHEDDSGMVSQVASTIGSLGGNVNLGAGGKYTQIASNVVAAQDVNITAAEIELLTADETGHNSQSDKDLKIGVFARIKSPFIDLINNVDAARQSDGRLQGVQGMAAAANAYQAGSAIAAAATSGVAGSGSLFSAEAGIGFKSSSSSAEGSSTVSRGSTIQGGGNVNLTSTSGDIHIVQGNLSAGNTLSLDSARDILLEAGKAHVQDKSNNAGAEVGVGVSVGAQTGVYVYAEASVGSSKSNASSSTWQNTELTGKNISLKAEGDTTLRGATATADRIDVKTGGTLTIESLQDIAESMSKDSQVGGRVQVSLGTAWDASGYASASKANSSYKGVGQQSGLFAGDGGYHVDATHVNLIGGAIASTNAANSELTAETLTFTDLQNEMDYRSSTGNISGGFGGSLNKGGTNVPNGEGKQAGVPVEGGSSGPTFSPGVPVVSSGGDSSTTYATLTEGNITIGGKKTTAAELGINTDASAAHTALDAMPNAEQLIREQQTIASSLSTVQAAAKQAANDIGSYDANKIEAAYLESLSPKEREAFQKLQGEARYDAIAGFDPSYGDALIKQQQWGPGGKYGRALDAVVTALAGSLAGQGGGQVASNALAPYAAELIGKTFDPNKQSALPSDALQVLSHAILGAILAEAGGGSAGDGALAAGSGELAAKFLGDYYAKQNDGQLTPEQEQQIKALGQAVGAVAGGLGGDGLGGAALGAAIAQNAVENNYLNHSERMEYLQAVIDCKKENPQACAERDKLATLLNSRNDALIAACQFNAQSAQCGAEKAKLADATLSLIDNEASYMSWLKSHAVELGVAVVKEDQAKDILTHTSTLDAVYKYSCATAGHCNPDTYKSLIGSGDYDQAATNYLLNRVFGTGGQLAGVGGNLAGLAGSSVDLVPIIKAGKQIQAWKDDYDRAQQIGGIPMLLEKYDALWGGVKDYAGSAWDLLRYEVGNVQKWNLADVVSSGYDKGDIGMDVTMTVISFGELAALKATLKAQRLAVLEPKPVGGSKPLPPDLPPPAKPIAEEAKPGTDKPSSGKGTTRTGVVRTNAADWRTLRDDWDQLGYGEALSAENRSAIAKGRTPKVDDAWIKMFPEDAGLKGEKISMHHIAGSPITVPWPETRHRDAHMPGGFRYNPGGPGSSLPAYPPKNEVE